MSRVTTIAVVAAVAAIAAAISYQVVTSDRRAAPDAPSSTPAATAPDSPAGASVAALFDCVREANGTLISAHRGGPAPGFPENALETMQRMAPTTPVLEIDVAESADGVLFLLHDSTLDRTTTGTGEVAGTQWAEIQALRLIDNDGAVTDFNPPRLDAVLAWAQDAGAILQLDKKRSTRFERIVEAVRAADMEDRVVVITYSLEDALVLHRMAPRIAISASVNDPDDLDLLAAEGVDLSRILAWTGTREPRPALWSALRARRVEPLFGTLGRPETRLDSIYAADGDVSEYRDLSRDGLVLLATDEPEAAAAVLDSDDRARTACGL